MRILMLAVALSVLTACAGSGPSADRLRIDPPAPSLTEPCDYATELPNRSMSQREVEEFWIEDRRRLAECRGKHEGLTNWSQDVVTAVSGVR